MNTIKKENLKKALSTTITVASLMEILAQYDGRFPVCFIDKKNNMLPITKKDIAMKKINILLPNHSHVFDIAALVINKN